MFAALMHDAGIARVLGVRTGGSGCGFIVDPPALMLPNAKLAFRVPNCMRRSGDGTDEVAGIAPDLPAPKDRRYRIFPACHWPRWRRALFFPGSICSS